MIRRAFCRKKQGIPLQGEHHVSGTMDGLDRFGPGSRELSLGIICQHGNDTGCIALLRGNEEVRSDPNGGQEFLIEGIGVFGIDVRFVPDQLSRLNLDVYKRQQQRWAAGVRD